MNSNSQKILRRIEQNYAGLRELFIGYPNLDSGFISSDASDYSKLGAAIGNNTHLETLNVGPNHILDIASNEFFDGLKRNLSIKYLGINGGNQTKSSGT